MRPAKPLSVLREALAVAAASAALGLAVNEVRRDGLPLVAREPYQTLVPCPEPGGEVAGLAAHDPALESPRTFLVDARSPDEFAHWHLRGAVNVPFDWLDPLPPDRLEWLARTVAASGATRVVVYGDGDRPDSGEFLAKELSGRGIRHVHYVVGGAPALAGGAAP